MRPCLTALNVYPFLFLFPYVNLLPLFAIVSCDAQQLGVTQRIPPDAGEHGLTKGPFELQQEILQWFD